MVIMPMRTQGDPRFSLYYLIINKEQEICVFGKINKKKNTGGVSNRVA